jgi:hypothetical protein
MGKSLAVRGFVSAIFPFEDIEYQFLHCNLLA